ncbi:MAG: 3-hydroxyacyl-CoA dehydrogenase family protein, partial [Candidatus Aenigmatarchaeota archaeon]
VNPEAFDAKMKEAGMPMAPFELLDYVGLDVQLHSMEYFSKTLSEEYEPPEVLRNMVESEDLGKKSGQGFYDWSEGRPDIDTSKSTDKFDMN